MASVFSAELSKVDKARVIVLAEKKTTELPGKNHKEVKKLVEKTNHVVISNRYRVACETLRQSGISYTL